MPVFRFNKAFDMVRGAKARLQPEGADARGVLPNLDQDDDRQNMSEQRKRLKSKKRELRRIKQEIRRIKRGNHATGEMQFTDQRRWKRRVQQEIFELERQLHLAVGEEPVMGALPDFLVIGTQKGGTTNLYHLLAQHPLVEPCARKELHFFDNNFDLGVDWYRRCFPTPRWEDGQRTITGEATPYYLFHPLAPERMAEVAPEARLIALLRNPVDRAYSHYQMGTRKGKEPRTFEEAIEIDEEVSRREYLARGVYVDQLLRWSEFFPREQMLVLKSENFFESPNESLKTVLEFLGLPELVPEAAELDTKRNAGRYEGEMDPATRRRLEEYFEGHNRRLYDYLGVDFGW